MKRLIYTFALLFVTLGVMAHDLSAGLYIYFEKPSAWNASVLQFMIGHGSYSIGYEMSKVSNTNIYYWKTDSWGGYTEWAVFGNDSKWGSEGSSVSHRHQYSKYKTTVGTASITYKYNLVTTAGAIGSTGTSYTFLNKTHEIESYVDDVESSAGGTVSATSYKLSSATATVATSGTTSIEAAYTATIKLTAEVNDGYEFIGWYDGSTLLSSSATYSSYSAPNSAKEISAKFRKLAVAEPQIVSFSPSASEIDLGQSVTFNVEVENADKKDVVFKNGNTVITPPWKPAEGGVYTITANLNGATSKSVNVTVYAATIYFDNTISGWSNVYAYCWNPDADENAAWPGVKLSNQVGNIYTYKSTKIYKKVIFTNNSEQTADLDFENGKTYSMPEPIPFVAGTKELCGSAWNGSDEANKMEEVDGVFKKTFTNVPAGTHKFKIVYKGSWLGHYNRFSSEYSSTCINDNDDNIQFTLDATATVIISYNNSTDKIELKVVYDNFEEGKKIYFSSDKGGSLYAAYLFGESGETWVELSQEYANIYSATVPNGNWGGVIFCSMKSETLNRTNINSKTKYLEYEGKNWYKWTSESEWRNFENLIYAGQKLYFKPDSNWEADGARFAAYYWDILGENRWADCVYDSVDHAYNVIAPSKEVNSFDCVWTNIKFVRMNPAFTDKNDWNKGDEDQTGKPKRVWNQTDDLVYNRTEDFFIVKLTKKNGDAWDWDSADLNNWISFSHPFKGAIFFEPNASLKATAKKRFSIYLWNGFDENCWVKMQPLATHPDIYCVIIPEGYWTGANICSMNPDNEINGWDKDKNDKYLYLLNQTDNLTYHSDKLLYQAPDTWDFMVPADECWSMLNLPKAEDIDCSGDITAGIYYTYFKRTLSISTPEDIAKWHWISLPYNVKISDIEGGEYGTDFIIQKYDTEARAKWENNIAIENESAWRWMDDSETLLAGKGYILAVSDAKDSYSLTFVSETDLNVVSDRFDGNNIDYSSAVAESANWHLVGTGVYGSVGDYEGVNYVAVPQTNGNDYDYYSLSEGSNNRLAPYSAFFVQYAGDYSFTKASGEQPALAPRLAKKVDDVERYYVDIKGESEEAQTAIFLAVDGTEDYVVGQDFLHLGASGASLQLYSLQGQNILSFNYLQSVERTIVLGGYIAKGGIYEISLRAIGNATSIVLYDKFTGEGIDLLSDTYEFEAEKGAIDGRFEIIISYAQQGGTTTEFSGEDFGNLSVLLNNELVVFEGLTLGEDVMIYDVMGRCVKLFKATEQKAEICLVGGVYLLHHNNETIKFIVNK